MDRGYYTQGADGVLFAGGQNAKSAAIQEEEILKGVLKSLAWTLLWSRAGAARAIGTWIFRPRLHASRICCTEFMVF